MKKVQPVSVKVKIGFKDYFDFNLAQYYKKSSTKITVSIGIVILAVFISALFGNKGAVEITKNSTLIGCMAFAIFFLWFYRPIIILLNTRGILKNSKIVTKEHTYLFDSDGFTVSSISSSFKTKWNDILLVNEYKNCFCIYIDRNKAFLVPKRVFNDMKENMESMKQIMKTYMPAKKLKIRI